MPDMISQSYCIVIDEVISHSYRILRRTETAMHAQSTVRIESEMTEIEPAVRHRREHRTEDGQEQIRDEAKRHRPRGYPPGRSSLSTIS